MRLSLRFRLAFANLICALILVASPPVLVLDMRIMANRRMADELVHFVDHNGVPADLLNDK